VDFAALHPEHHLLHTVVARVLPSTVGSNQFPSQFCKHLERWSDKELWDVDTAADIPPQQH
jgi:hypothetical protein